MLTALSYMVGAYIIARCFEMVAPKVDGENHGIVKFMAALTIIITMFMICIITLKASDVARAGASAITSPLKMPD